MLQMEVNVYDLGPPTCNTSSLAHLNSTNVGANYHISLVSWRCVRTTMEP
jgi:hypothetical protein